MPFITYAEVSTHIPIEIRSDLSNSSTFNEFESQSSIIITKITGITPPVDAVDADDWTKLPSAYLTAYLYGKVNVEATQTELHKKLDALYRMAKDLLSIEVSRGITTSIDHAVTGDMDNLLSF